MRTTRLLTLGITGLAICATAWAQIDGPTPLAWRYSPNSSVAPSGQPVMNGDTVVITAGNRLFGLDRKSGNQRWRFPLADPIPGNFRNGAALVDGVVAAYGDNKVIYAVDAANGQPKWTYTPPTPILGQPVVAGKLLVFAMSDSTLMAINGSDGTAAWTAPFKVFAGLTGGLVAKDNNLVYMTAAYEMFCMNVATQKTNWKQRFSVVTSDSTPTLFGDNLFLNMGTFAACVGLSNGSVKWQINTGEQLAYSPAVSSDATLVVSRDGNAFVLNTKNGQPLVRKAIDLGSTPVVRPTALDKTFLVPTINGAINLINPKGETLWSFLIRPIGKITVTASTTGGGAGSGGRGGGGAMGGGQAGKEQVIVAIPAAGPAVVAGSTLFVQGIDGSLLAFDKNDGVDLTGPSVKMIWPNPGDQVSGQPGLELGFRIVDEGVGVNNATMKIQIDGKDAEFTYGRDGFALIRITSSGKNPPLFNGRRTITVIATDWLGNETKSQFLLTVDNTLKPVAAPWAGTNPTAGGGGDMGGGRGGGGRGGG